MNFSKAHLTGWYNDRTHPVREGVYEVETKSGTRFFAYWSPKLRKWYEHNIDMHQAVYAEYPTNRSYWWRGLNRPFSEIMGEE